MEQENLGLELAKAAVEGTGPKVVDKFAEVFRDIFPFWGCRRKAVDVYISEIENSSMSPEAKMFAIANVKKKFREMRNQSAIIDVAYDAVGDEESTAPNGLPDADSEFVLRLLDAGKFVSDEDLQLLWGNVLAGEFESPGCTPKSIIRILSELSKDEAAAFSNLCSLGVDILADTGSDIENIGFDFLIDETEDYLRQLNIDSEVLQELEQCGLINYTSAIYTRPLRFVDFPYIHIVSESHVITVINTTNDFPVGRIMLTKAGNCLLRFMPRRYNTFHMEAIKCYLEHNGLGVSQTPSIRIIGAREGKGIDMECSYERIPIESQQTQV